MRYTYYKDTVGEWRWRLTANNSQIIAISSEGYTQKAGCLHAIDIVKQQPLGSSFETYQDIGSKWRWRFKAANGLIIATAGQSYYNLVDCEHSIALVKQSKNAPVEEV